MNTANCRVVGTGTRKGVEFYSGPSPQEAADVARTTADTHEESVVFFRRDGSSTLVHPSSHPQGPADYVNDRT